LVAGGDETRARITSPMLEGTKQTNAIISEKGGHLFCGEVVVHDEGNPSGRRGISDGLEEEDHEGEDLAIQVDSILVKSILCATCRGKVQKIPSLGITQSPKLESFPHRLVLHPPSFRRPSLETLHHFIERNCVGKARHLSLEEGRQW